MRQTRTLPEFFCTDFPNLKNSQFIKLNCNLNHHGLPAFHDFNRLVCEFIISAQTG